MKLKELKKCIDECCEYAGDLDADVEVWFKKSAYCIEFIDQFSVVPTVTITIGKKMYSEDE